MLRKNNARDNPGKSRQKYVKLGVGIHDLAKLKKGDVVWLEVPKNPTCEVADIRAMAKITSSMGIILAVDQTFAPPPLLNAFDFGADVVMHSTTKYLSGHSDCLGGALVVKNPQMRAQLLSQRTLTGSVPGSLNTWLLLRSLRTLSVRVKAQSKSAAAIAAWLDTEGRKYGVTRVFHPSLESHPTHEFAAIQMPSGLYGGVLSFMLQDASSAQKLGSFTHFFKDATSLGGVESLIEWRHKWAPEESKNLLRISVGLEDSDDLINDLQSALRQVAEEYAII